MKRSDRHGIVPLLLREFLRDGILALLFSRMELCAQFLFPYDSKLFLIVFTKVTVYELVGPWLWKSKFILGFHLWSARKVQFRACFHSQVRHSLDPLPLEKSAQHCSHWIASDTSSLRVWLRPHQGLDGPSWYIWHLQRSSGRRVYRSPRNHMLTEWWVTSLVRASWCFWMRARWLLQHHHHSTQRSGRCSLDQRLPGQCLRWNFNESLVDYWWLLLKWLHDRQCA